MLERFYVFSRTLTFSILVAVTGDGDPGRGGWLARHASQYNHLKKESKIFPGQDSTYRPSIPVEFRKHP